MKNNIFLPTFQLHIKQSCKPILEFFSNRRKKNYKIVRILIKLPNKNEKEFFKSTITKFSYFCINHKDPITTIAFKNDILVNISDLKRQKALNFNFILRFLELDFTKTNALVQRKLIKIFLRNRIERVRMLLNEVEESLFAGIRSEENKFKTEFDLTILHNVETIKGLDNMDRSCYSFFGRIIFCSEEIESFVEDIRNKRFLRELIKDKGKICFKTIKQRRNVWHKDINITAELIFSLSED